jgi:LytS/YehU family sensor histidine kinase
MAGIWTALYCLGYAIRRARQAELGRLTADIVAKDAALQALKAQINPHFFFNSLNSVRALVFIDQEAAARMIDQVVALMRYALDSQQSDTVPLSEELRIVRTYLMVEKTRFQSRLVIEEQIEAQVETWPVPPMILQTLVENAVKYGTATSAGPTTVRLTIHADQERLTVEIANNGRLATSSQSTGLGLSNARRRMTLLYGASAKLDLTEKAGWVVASLQLPRPLL